MTITIQLDAATEAALGNAAAIAGKSSEDYVADLVKRAVVAPPPLGWQGQDLLEIIKIFGGRPGVGMAWQSVFLKWGTRQREDLDYAIKQLEAAGYIESVSRTSTELMLTPAGYKA